MSQKDIDDIKKKVSEGAEWTQKQAADLERGLNDGLSQASGSIRSGISFALNQASIARTQAEDLGETASQQMKSVENTVLGTVRQNVTHGIRWATEYPYAAYGLAAVGVLLFPGPRSFLSRHVFGAFQSQESAFRGATEKFSTLSESTGTLLKSQEEATVKASKALEDFLAAKATATAAHDELTSLSYKLSSTVDKLEGVQESLQPLKHDDVTVLQADIARTTSEVNNKYKEVSRIIAQLHSNGA